ncbi:MAG TPA: DUF1963 domain-containing protein [Phycisphaerales bacterium]|nr:DUF1963 domain-containing protein [Phycisphaerales bacterium]
MTREELQTTLTTEFGSAAAAELIKFALPTAHMALEACPAEGIPTGASRYGGEPDVPAGFVWPTCATRRGHKPEGLVYPLTFVAQVNFAEAAPCLKSDPLWPSDGTLLFFFDSICMPNGLYDPADAAGLRLLYVPAGTPIQRMHAPPHTPPTPSDASKFVLSARRIAFRPGWTLPEPEYAFDPESEFGFAFDPDGENDNPDYDYGHDWWREIFKTGREPYHRLGGYAAPEQYDPRSDCARAARGHFAVTTKIGRLEHQKLAQAAPQSDGPWRLLLQFDLSAEPDSACGYDGTQFFLCASEASIRSRSFSAAWWSWDQD